MPALLEVAAPNLPQPRIRRGPVRALVRRIVDAASGHARLRLAAAR